MSDPTILVYLQSAGRAMSLGGLNGEYTEKMPLYQHFTTLSSRTLASQLTMILI